MNKICATLLCACLAVASASAQTQQDPAKKDPAPKAAPMAAPKDVLKDPPKDTLKKEPPGVNCATVQRMRESEAGKDRAPKAMPSKDGGIDCMDNVVDPKRPMA